jgi:Ca-activated chloride channel family protein
LFSFEGGHVGRSPEPVMHQITSSRLRPLPAALAVALLLGACTTANEGQRSASESPRRTEVKRELSAETTPSGDRDAMAETQSLDDRRQDAAAGAERSVAPRPMAPPAEPEPSASLASAREAKAHRARPAIGNAVGASALAQTDTVADLQRQQGPADRERYAEIETNPVFATIDTPVSTFAVDVDTGAYSNARRFLAQGRLPPSDAVRVEEFINYFDYDYPIPASPEQPFSVHTELALAPWNGDRWLLQVGLKGFEVTREQLPASNLVFLLDVSGSMHSADKLPLVKTAMRKLVTQLRPQDRVAIVVYAGAAGLVLPATSGADHATILAALDGLQAGGSTNGGQGIQLAYSIARDNYIEGGVNRVILATDGDFNVGTVNQSALEDLVSRERNSGVALTTLGFGQGNYNDQLAERLANLGDGNHAYIDTEREAHKVLVDELGANLLTIARDVKIQIEFNPAVVAEYRLIGYENRLLAREDFNNDQVDAGEIGAGHTVTALYELTPVSSGAQRLPPLRYQSAAPVGGLGNEVAYLKLRYKQPDEDRSRLIEQPVRLGEHIGAGSEQLRFAAAVAAFGQALRGGTYLDGYRLDDIAALARASAGPDPFGLRGELIELIGTAASLSATGQPQQISQIAH